MSTAGDRQALDAASQEGWGVVAHEHLAAFWVRGDCMSGDGINDRDIVFVDTDRKPGHGDIGVFFVANEHGGMDRMLKRLGLSKGIRLVPSNPAYDTEVIENEKAVFMVGTVVASARVT